ncbi:hypothetical protein EDD37DRAFT_660102 [Exophiala viscosa]|uniref:uncharacterized protein n=1 Tax=Exophiala viscosa TaxID=2486360 RepID=UPI00219EB6BD|nr:hypothetical protein EDD37DRAFT_660102 [Exophiala viscosa]
MSTPVRAQSISSLYTLLSNPPQYPRNPTHQEHDPLVLYIVRVPGSKDVFLTPLKPPTKASISIEAVQSSLYFLHVERPEDDDLRKSLETTTHTDERRENISPIQRKPLPPTTYANYPASQRPPTPPKSYPHHQPPLHGSQDATQAERHAARGAHLRLSTSDPMESSTTQRKPVGARPMPLRPTIDTSNHGQLKSNHTDSLSNGEGHFTVRRKPVQSASPTEEANVSPTPTEPDRPLRNLISPARSPEILGAGDVRITLIRRDPASGSQWNVGSLIKRDTALRDNGLSKVDIELSSPGYTKFGRVGRTGERCFNRTVEYRVVPNSEKSIKTRQRSNSSELFSDLASLNNRKPRQAYSFMSPWQGMCFFSNAVDGRSLRCRHTLSSTNSPNVGVMADVAELRFNLAWSILRPKDANRQATNEMPPTSPTSPTAISGSSSNKDQWRRSFQAFTHKARAQLSRSESDNGMLEFQQSLRDFAQPESPKERRMNLDLGRERAGGGFKGHSAKLGKLIIDDEGLKMCDLVVAACMGVWWQHYAGD